MGTGQHGRHPLQDRPELFSDRDGVECYEMRSNHNGAFESWISQPRFLSVRQAGL
jgi:hypothetical protein